MWCFMSWCEQFIVHHLLTQGINRTNPYAVIDGLMNTARFPMLWLWADCEAAGEFSPRLSDEQDGSARRLFDLASNYQEYETVFTYARRGRLHLDLIENRIVATGRMRDETRSDAYNRLIDAFQVESEVTQTQLRTGILNGVGPTVRVSGNRFSYRTDALSFASMASSARPSLDHRFELPETWSIRGFTLAEYRDVIGTVWLLSLVHFCARMIACQVGCGHYGYLDGLLIMDRRKLISLVSERAGQSETVVGRIVELLTFGSSGIRSPDIALQPIVPIKGGVCAVCPILLSNSALERNLLVLLNRTPEGKADYSRLSEQREDLHRGRFRKALVSRRLRLENCKVANWGDASDIDLALVDDDDSCCLILELKSFLAPADPREVHEKALEIRKGIDQVRHRRDMTSVGRTELDRAIRINEEYAVYFAVSCEASTACGMEYADDVPVVRSADLIARLAKGETLRNVCRRLECHEHLPIEGVDYEARWRDFEIGPWVLEWYRPWILREYRPDV